MRDEPTWQEAIHTVLAATGRPMRAEEITADIVKRRLRHNLGATPAATVHAQLAQSIKHKADASPFLRVDKGLFTLRESHHVRKSGRNGGRKSTAVRPGERPKVLTVDDRTPSDEPQYAVVTSFGMYWRRESVEWTAKPRLLGVQATGATPVNFCDQIGLYLLYDAREVIYVGRSTDRPVGRRLFEHTQDRLATRWDHFSWFGMRPVSEAGELRTLPPGYAADGVLPAMEAVLIEALEPRQNRKRGDDLAAVEYQQHSDPGIDRKRLVEAFHTG